MKISIVTPAYNSAKTISKNLESVWLQRNVCVEHIVIDNLSTDGTSAIVKNYEKAIFYSEGDKGISDAFNKGIQKSSGDIIGILNSDDFYLNECVLEKVVQVFKDKPEVMFVHGDILFRDNEFGSNIRRPLNCSVELAMPFNHPTMFVRKELYEKIGLFRTDFKYCMDYEWVMRLFDKSRKLKYKIHYFNEFPFVEMSAGGASYMHELKMVDEIERALKLHGFYGIRSFINLLLRKFRIKLKSIVPSMAVSFYRKFKWN